MLAPACPRHTSSVGGNMTKAINECLDSSREKSIRSRLILLDFFSGLPLRLCFLLSSNQPLLLPFVSWPSDFSTFRLPLMLYFSSSLPLFVNPLFVILDFSFSSLAISPQCLQNQSHYKSRDNFSYFAVKSNYRHCKVYDSALH